MLENGESAKAFDLFMQAAKGVLTETFLERIVQPQQQQRMDVDAAAVVDAIDDSSETLAQYYLKVIQLFEQYSALDHVIVLAKTAIRVLDGRVDDPKLAMFQSIVFANHLALGHYDEAYYALIDNAQSSRRKDCLRQLVICLFQQKRLDLLMRFPYVRLHDELEEIIESRARSMAVEGNRYYDFLFAFHVTQENMRKGKHSLSLAKST